MLTNTGQDAPFNELMRAKLILHVWMEILILIPQRSNCLLHALHVTDGTQWDIVLSNWQGWNTAVSVVSPIWDFNGHARIFILRHNWT